VEPEFIDRLGAELVIQDVSIGTNLNIQVLRGYATLDKLALISSPDVFNQLTNPEGTQRDPNEAHAKAVLAYALGSLDAEPSSEPRAFPEIILNVRDLSVISILSAGGEVIDFRSSSDENLNFVGSLKINVEGIDNEDGKAPQISRVDGNHRLLHVKKKLADEPEQEFPIVPFSMFVGLTPDQERAIFRDINGEQRPMATAHLDAIRLRLQSPHVMVQTESGQALWIAEQLQKNEEAPFFGLVFFGGDRSVFTSNGLQVPPVRINSLKTAVIATLRESQLISTILTPSEVQATAETALSDAATQYKLLTLYWNSVKKAFPEAWQDRKNYILLQSIGLQAFSRLGGVIIDDHIQSKKFKQEDFDSVMLHIASKIDLVRTAGWEGFAGLAGTKVVFEKLKTAKIEGFDRSLVLQALNDPSLSPLDE
jgi:DGQHR domain-containing protein